MSPTGWILNTGPQLWFELHDYAWRYPCEATAADQRQARAWLATFAQRLPSYGCRCRAKWQQLMTLCPPPLGGRAAFYWWTVAIHDRVNFQLGKPLHAAEWSLQHPLFSDV